MPADAKRALAAAGNFQLDCVAEEAAAFGRGHIHDTFLLSCRGGRKYVLQGINGKVLTCPEAHIDNAGKVSRHLRAKTEDPRRRLCAVPARSGAYFWVEKGGAYWRAFDYIEGTVSRDSAENEEEAYQAGRAFGAFLAALSDLPAGELRETLPYFHHTPKRFLALERAAAKDALGRAREARAELDFAFSQKEIAGTLEAFAERGDLALRVVHNDTKINNVLFDKVTGEGLCVVDLDTVMPGLALYDFGDLARGAASASSEDERDLGEVAVRVPIFTALAKGFLEELGGELTPLERDLMPFSAKLIAYELGLRFLTDHLEGDSYFKIGRPGQNLDRARAQFALMRDFSKKEDALRAAVSRLA